MPKFARFTRISLAALGCLLCFSGKTFARQQNAPPQTAEGTTNTGAIVHVAAPPAPIPATNPSDPVAVAPRQPVFVPELTIAGHTVMRLRATPRVVYRRKSGPSTCVGVSALS
jgi:hypothetical protein